MVEHIETKATMMMKTMMNRLATVWNPVLRHYPQLDGMARDMITNQNPWGQWELVEIF